MLNSACHARSAGGTESAVADTLRALFHATPVYLFATSVAAIVGAARR